MRLLFILLLSELGLAIPAQNTLKDLDVSKYTGYKVLAVIPNTEAQVAYLASFKINTTLNCSLDWWSEPSLPAVTVSLAVNPDCLDYIITEFKTEGLSVRVTIPDLEELISLEKNYRFLSQLYRKPYDWNEEVYHSLPEINERIDWLVGHYPEVLSTHELATSYENRSIEVIIVREPGPITKPVIWIDCGIHAREWVSPPTCLHAIERLIDSMNSLDARENLLAVFDFYIIPVANPDGYVYTWTTDRMWRKNRRPIVGAEKPAVPSWGWGGQLSTKCEYGVDPNRNFPINFFGQGASSNPCDDSYHGAEPFSEAESLAIKNGIQDMQTKYGKDRIAAFVSIHAYSQLWMSPYGYKKTHSEDHKDQMRVMKEAVDSLAKVYGTRFTYGPISEVIYVASGSSVDWAYEDAGIKYSFALEVRDKGEWGFLLPQEEIVATARETWAGLSSMAWAIAEEYGIKAV